MPLKLLLVMTCVLAACSPMPRSFDVVSPTPLEPAPSETTFINGGVCPTRFDDTLERAIGCESGAGRLRVYALVDDDDKPVTWWMQLGAMEQRLHAGNAFSYPRAIAEVDIDRDGDSEWLIKTFDLASHGTNWQQLGLFVRLGGRLRQVSLDGELLAIRVGGISRMGEGAACVGGRLVRLRTVAEDRQNIHWSYSRRSYEIEGATAREVGEVRRGVLTLQDYNDPKLDPYYAVNCHGVTYP